MTLTSSLGPSPRYLQLRSYDATTAKARRRRGGRASEGGIDWQQRSAAMFQLPALPSLAGPLPHEQRMHTSAPLDGSHSRGSSARPHSDNGRRRSKGAAGSRSSKPRSAKLAKATKPADLMYLVPHNKEEAKQYKSILVFCDVKLREGSVRRRKVADGGPDTAATAACCHVLDELSGPLWAPFAKIVTKLRNEVLVALYSDYVEPTAEPPYVQRVPYHALAAQVRLPCPMVQLSAAGAVTCL